MVMSGGYGENEGREEVKGGLVPYEDNISDEVILFNNFSVLRKRKKYGQYLTIANSLYPSFVLRSHSTEETSKQH